MKPDCALAMIGLGVMGANLARNFARHGHRVAVFDRERETTRAVAERHPEAGFVACESLEALVAAVARPRVFILLVPAGAPVDEALAGLSLLLDADDVVVDAGNSLFHDTDRRAAATASLPWHFVGMGVSGGSEGALAGPSMMPGGSPASWRRLRPLLESVAATSDTGPCVADCGRGSAGHFVKMVHNGIEYGDMQLIAEIASLLRDGLGLTPARCADVFDAWNAGELESYLIEITAKIFRTEDPKRPGHLLLDAILDRAGQKGTGRWTIQAALDLGVAIPTIAAAVDARIQSAARDERLEASALFAGSGGTGGSGGRRGPDDGASDRPGDAMRRLEGVDADALRDALYAAKIASYGQGFELLARGSLAYDYGTDLAEIARIWKAGCIIRARFLDPVRRAFASSPGPTPLVGGQRPPLLVLQPEFVRLLRERLPALRRVVAAAASAGFPIPGLSASLAWLDGLTTARGSASLIQAQRDWFGHHGYERVDAPGIPDHTDWETARRLR